MADVLSQGEIDALLSALSTGEMDVEDLIKEDEAKRITNYDFKRALRFSKDQVRSLSRIHENFARLLTTVFSAQLRTFVQIHVTSVDQLPYEEFIRSIPSTTLLSIFDAYPLEGRFLIEVNPNIGYAMVDRILGGRGTGMNKVETLTEIESRILSQLFNHMLDSFQQAWTSIIDLQPVMEDLEVNPQFVQLQSPNETVVVISLSTTINETSGMINVCLPYVVLEELLPKLSAHYWMQSPNKERDENEVKDIRRSVRQAMIDVETILGTSEMTVSELKDLQIGDVLELNQSIHTPLMTKVGGKPKYSVQPGRKKQRIAVQIIEEIKEDADDE
ncbi:flagellar motor switch protein FliM [Geomicrobium sp. JCM 19038]|uniref:flagellar motor switch protein FliM n=1 Tax=Geomicrobium sp. JCM 19038 TaxID=1460635 RepID=UPI00045F370A|nr:flagellar motor switch protein FliM [Geomicrobium sp. JCM 19038]GAK07535.1 flagellar motor switch protein FliM [Geomicrobium sp. JCM 19038]